MAQGTPLHWLHLRAECRRQAGGEPSVRLLLWETVVFEASFRAGALLSVLALLVGVPVAQVAGSWTLPITWTVSWVAVVAYGFVSYRATAVGGAPGCRLDGGFGGEPAALRSPSCWRKRLWSAPTACRSVCRRCRARRASA